MDVCRGPRLLDPVHASPHFKDIVNAGRIYVFPTPLDLFREHLPSGDLDRLLVFPNFAFPLIVAAAAAAAGT